MRKVRVRAAIVVAVTSLSAIATVSSLASGAESGRQVNLHPNGGTDTGTSLVQIAADVPHARAIFYKLTSKPDVRLHVETIANCTDSSDIGDLGKQRRTEFSAKTPLMRKLNTGKAKFSDCLLSITGELPKDYDFEAGHPKLTLQVIVKR